MHWRASGGGGPGIAWAYPEPFPQVARLAGHVAFDLDAVGVTLGAGVFTGVRP